MKKLFLLIFGPPATQESVKAVVEVMPEVVIWRYDMPNAFYIISSSSAEQIAESYRAKRKDTGRFLVAEVDNNNTQGWLPDGTWHLINNLSLKPKED